MLLKEKSDIKNNYNSSLNLRKQIDNTTLALNTNNSRKSMPDNKLFFKE